LIEQNILIATCRPALAVRGCARYSARPDIHHAGKSSTEQTAPTPDRPMEVLFRRRAGIFMAHLAQQRRGFQNHAEWGFSLGPEYKLLTENDIGETVMATPAIADGVLYMRGGQHLFTIGAK
jgi:hypothetical protein